MVSPDEAETAIRTRRTLSDEQALAVRALTRSAHGVEVLRAPAGAGKTFALDAARQAWQASGKTAADELDLGPDLDFGCSGVRLALYTQCEYTPHHEPDEDRTGATARRSD